MKKQLTSYLRVWMMVAFCATMLVIAMGVGRQRQSRIAVIGSAQQQGQFLFSATEIIRLAGGNPANDSDIAKLDTRTGAVYRFRGNVNIASVQNTWELRVPPVKEETSGLLEIQNILPPRPTVEVVRPVTFLVDIVHGTTWILRETTSTNARWQPVNIFRSAEFH